MKYCQHCGDQIADEAVICPHCGCAVEQISVKSNDNSGLKTAAKVFMILGCITYAWFLISLCWTIPMTVHYFNAVKNKQPVSTGFKVCSLLFVDIIAGIIMLCDDKD